MRPEPMAQRVSNRRWPGVFCFAVLICSCASDAGFKAALPRWEKLHTDPSFSAYAATFVAAQYAQRLGNKTGCYDRDADTTVDLIVVVESSGRISAAYADKDSRKAKCFRKAFLSARMPIPPFSPFPMRLKIR
jgi:hypothetical protein